VWFEDEGCSAMIPMFRAQPMSATQLVVGEACDVLWYNRRHFKATVELLGKFLQ